MASLPHHYVPVEVYLRSSYEPDAEYVDGEIEERAVGEFDHGIWQAAIMKWFWLHEKEWNIRVVPELRVQVARTRFRVPDVTVLDRNQPIEQIITHAPLAVFEVLSPEDTLTRTMRKLGDYAAMGIPHIWVVDPETKTYFRFENGELHKAATFSLPDRAIRFEIAEIEKLLD
jgi:Uma2 family endonuclease